MIEVVLLALLMVSLEFTSASCLDRSALLELVGHTLASMAFLELTRQVLHFVLEVVRLRA